MFTVIKEGVLMPVKYHLVLKGNPAKPTDPKKYYAVAASDGDVSLRELAGQIADISTVSVVDTIAVIESLLLLLPRLLLNGRIVRLGDFGSFSLTLVSRGADNQESFHVGLIEGVKLIFRAGKALKSALKQAQYSK